MTSDTPAITDLLAAFVANTGYDDIPDEVKAVARRQILDTVAVAWAGTAAPAAAAVTAMATANGAGTESTIWSTGAHAAAPAAAFANSMFAGALDYDNVNTLHADMITVPVAFALAEKTHASGRDVLGAVVLGSEIACRLGACSATAAHRGWFKTSICGVFGATACASRLLGLNEAQTRHALGIALIQACGTQQATIEQSLAKRLMNAFVARAGVECALLARMGVTGPRRPIEGQFGLLALYQEGTPEVITAALGSDYLYRNTATKKYPSCACTHCAIDAALLLLRRHQIKAAEIEHVEVEISPYMNRLVGAPFELGESPQVAAQFSVQYCVAAALAYGQFRLAQIDEEVIRGEAVRAVIPRVRIIVDPKRTSSRAALVRIRTSRLGAVEQDVSRLPGTPETPMSAQEWQDKMEDCLARGARPLAEAQRARLIDKLSRLDEVADLGGLFIPA